ncbi:MAG: hypothetical protein ACR2L2_19720 [Acidobacteriota bacterium]
MMKREVCLFLLLAAGLVLAGSFSPLSAQPADGVTATYAMGDVIAIDSAAQTLTLKTGAGDVLVRLEPATVYLRIPPGETRLDTAEKITLADVSVGDRVLARGKVSEDRKTVPTRQLIVISKTAIAQRNEKEREEWRQRGVAGTVQSINAETREITVSTPSRGAPRAVILAITDKTALKRYPPESVKFADAKPSSFSELKVGDQLRALGERSADGNRFQSEVVVSGAFVMAGGAVTKVNPETGEITIRNLVNNQPLTIVVNKDSVLRRFPPQMAQMLAMRAQATASPGGPVGVRPAGSPDQPARAAGPGAPPAAGAAGPSGLSAGGERRGMAAGGDMSEMLERLPALLVKDLKPGEMILVSSIAGANPSRVTAVILAAGLDALFAGPAMSGGGGASLGLPPGMSDFGIGFP